MFSVSSHFSRRLATFALAAGGCLPAQQLTMTSAVLPKAVAVDSCTIGQPAVHRSLPAGRDVTAGFDLVGDPGATYASSRFATAMIGAGEAFDSSLHGQCVVEQAPPGSFAGIGRQAVEVELWLARPQRLEFFMSVGVIAAATAPSSEGLIDLGNDGSVDFAFRSPAGQCDGDSAAVVLSLPAGAFRYRMEIATSLPVSSGSGWTCSAAVAASVVVRAAHATVVDEGGGCAQVGYHSIGLQATPVFDGESVQLDTYQDWPTDLSCIVLGFQPTGVVLPLTPACALLVQPDFVLLPAWPDSAVVPLGRLAPVSVYAQSLVLRAPFVGQPATTLLASQRLRIDTK